MKALVRRLLALLPILALGLILFGRTAMTDSLVPVSSLGGLSANDSVPWSQLGPNATALQTTFSTNSIGGIGITGTLTDIDSLVTVVCPMDTDCSWASPDVAGFSAGDSVIWTSDDANDGNGPLTLAFNKNVSGVGAFIQADAPGQFTAQIQVFNGSNSLGSFIAQSDSAGDAVFLGVLDETAANITSVVYSLTQCADLCADFAVDTLFINGTGAAAQASIAAAPTQIKFANVDASGTGKPRKVTVTNNGKVNATIAAVSTLAVFPIVPGSDLCSNQTIAPKKKCTVMVQFAPTAVGLVSGPLTITHNGAAPASVNLSGTGTAVAVKAPKSLALPPTAAGSTSAAKSLTVTNASATATVQMGLAQASGPAFVIAGGTDTCSGASIAPKGKCKIGIEFAAPQDATRGAKVTGTLGLDFTYGSNSGALPTVALSGKVK